MTGMESDFRAWTACVNEERYEDGIQYLHPNFVHNSKPLGHEGFKAYIEQVRQLLSGLEVSIDDLIADEEGECLATRLVVRCIPTQPWLGLQPNGKTITFFEHGFVSFADGKISSLLVVADLDGVRHQTSLAGASNPDFLSVHDTPTSQSLNGSALKIFYASYIETLTTDLSEAGVGKFVQPDVVRNAESLSLQQYVSLIEESNSKFRDMNATITMLVANEESQRIAARIKWTGTPLKVVAGVEPTGRSVEFHEHAIYQLEAGKIKRVWAIINWEEFRAQLTAEDH